MKWQQDLNFKIKLSVGYVLILLLVFSIARLSIWGAYHPVFSSLGTWETWIGFLRGIQFDISIIGLFVLPVIILLFLPVRCTKYVKGIHLLWCVLLVFFVFVLIADWAYFPEAKRHMTDELLYIKNEIGFLVHYALRQYGWVLVLILLGFLGFAKAGFWIINRFYKPTSEPWWKTGVALLCVLILGFVAIRGKLTRGKPLSMRSLNSFSTSTAQGVLMSNGVFSAYHTLRHAHVQAENPLPKEQAIARARELLSSKQERFVDDNYPLVRAVQPQKSFVPKNVFVVLLESWTPQYIDAYGKSSYGVTPNFDALAKRSVQFTHAYAVGVRSIYGVSAALAGIPLVPGSVQLSDGLELNQITSLARVLRGKGYYTAFMQSSLRSSYQMCNIATHVFEFEESYGMEDFPKLMNYQAEQDFGYDHDLLQFAADKAAAASQAGKPFLIFTFTGTTHAPFAPTTPQFEKYPRTSLENKYLNTLYYSDYAIGKLIERAQQEGWEKDTLFIFMADHTMGVAQQDDEIYQKFRIPYMIYAPSFLKAGQIDYPVSQLDLIPTLFHLLDLQEPFSALGVDVFGSTHNHQAFIVDGDNLALITPAGYIRHNRNKVVESSEALSSPVYQQMETDVLALDKSVTALFKNNRWMK